MHIPWDCTSQEPGDVSSFSYTPATTSKTYLKLLYGVCRHDSTAGTEHCLLWEDSEAWRSLDDTNHKVSGRTSLLASDAEHSWPRVKALSLLCLFLSFALLAFHCVASCRKTVRWNVQVIAAGTQLLLCLLLCLSLGMGLSTDTVLPQMLGNFFYGCSVHAEPGAAWWCGVLALGVSLFAGVLLLFPYMGGPSWVLRGAGAGAGGEWWAVTPEQEEQEEEELELDEGWEAVWGGEGEEQEEEDDDSFAGIRMQLRNKVRVEGRGR